MCCKFHEVRRNSQSIATIFGEVTAHFSQPKITEVDQSFLKEALINSGRSRLLFRIFRFEARIARNS